MAMVRRAPRGATPTRSGAPRTARRHGPVDSAHPAGLSSWLADSLTGLGWPWCRSEEPRIDADSVLRLFPGGPTRAQADSLRPIMTSAEFRRIDPREVGR
jgi:hypothetical protein